MMLDKSAFEKALQEDKAKSSNQPQAQPKNELQFPGQNKPNVQTTGKSKREQLWDQRRNKKASKISPAFAAPGPVIINELLKEIGLILLFLDNL